MWPEDIEMIFNFYRVMVFFWIFLGLVWLSGNVSIATDILRNEPKDQSSRQVLQISQKTKRLFT